MRSKNRHRNYSNTLLVILLLLVITYCVYKDVNATSITKRKGTIVNVAKHLRNAIHGVRKAVSTSSVEQVMMKYKPIDTANLTSELIYQLVENDIRSGNGQRGEGLLLNGINITAHDVTKMNNNLPKGVDIIKGYKVPKPFGVRPALIRIYEENEFYDKYGLWKVGKGPQNDTLMAVILDSITKVERNKTEDEENMVSPPLLPSLPDIETMETVTEHVAL